MMSKLTFPQHRRNDDGVALLMSLMVIVIASVLSLAVAGTILAQVKPTHLARKLTGSVGAAEAGIDVAQKYILNGELDGVLPCGPFEGDVSGSSDLPAYVASVRYYNDDPTGKPAPV